ncbi:oxidoreductase [compost metagenome]
MHNPSIAKRLTLPAEAVLPKLRHALESPKAKLRYPVTLLAHTMSILRRLLPGRALDWLLRSNG